MSREELEKRILEARYNLVSSKDKETIDILEELAIKALEQEPIEVEATKLQMAYNQGFEDCRKAVIDLINADWKYENLEIEVNNLPSVTPQEPKYCDRNICIKNEYNGIGCDECEVQNESID